jgi:L-2-hydroxyglutarate oxidase LhgO
MLVEAVEYDAIVIGAGVIGLSCGYQLAPEGV